MIAREIIPAGTCCIWCGEYDGAIEKNFGPPFFSKWPPYLENINFVRLQWKLISWGTWMWRTWWKYRHFFPSLHFFPKMANILRNINFVGSQWKFRSWGNFMWRTWWCYRNCYWSHHFLVPNILLTMAYCYAVVARWAIQAPGSLLLFFHFDIYYLRKYNS